MVWRGWVRLVVVVVWFGCVAAGCLLDAFKPCAPCKEDGACRASERCVHGYCEPNDLLYQCVGSLPEGGLDDAGPQEPQPERVCIPGQSESCYSGPRGTDGKGVCKSGLRYCSRDGVWGGCLGEVLPEQERCDGRDNDCDGVVDQGFSDLGKPCRVGVGACEASGTWVCASDGKRAVCAATAGEPKTEICNGIDDDCDGKVDEDLIRSCYTGPASSKGFGLCRDGKQTCEKGVWGACVGEILPTQEVCDQRDNNCDGQVDEDCPCTAGAQQVCYSGPKGTEGVGLCREGLQRCGQDKRWGPCLNGIVPALEICDGLDNNCDGNIDESFPEKSRDCQIPQRTGRCAQGSYLCRGNALLCVPRFSASQEICDGQDNDCNGLIDESFPLQGASCVVSQQQGACRDGTQACVGGRATCVPLRQPQPEVCNGLDDDCDGSIDFGCAWVLSGGGDGEDTVYSVKVDAQRQVVLAGSFAQTARFGTLSPLLASGARNAFFAGVASQGAFSWVVAARSNQASEGIGLAADATGGLYAVGHFRGDLRLGTQSFTTAGPQEQAVFVARINPSGAVTWALSADSDQNDTVIGVHADAQGVATAGTFRGTGFQIASRLLSNPQPGTAQGWIAYFDHSGVLRWAQKIASTSAEVQIKAMSPALRGSVFVLGAYTEKLTFEDGTQLQGVSGRRTAFFAQFDTTGKLLLAQSLTGGGEVAPLSLAVSDVGDILVVGRFVQNLQTPPLAGLQSPSEALFAAQMDAKGQFVWARILSTQPEVAIQAAQSATQRWFLLGSFARSFSLDGQSVQALHPEGTKSLFVAYLDGKGQARWLTSASSPSAESLEPSALWADTSGNVYVGASMRAETRCGAATAQMIGKQQDLLVWKISRP